MKARKSARFKATPINIKNGNTAPYFIVEPDGRAKKEEIEKLADEHFRANSGLARYSNWQLSIDKI